MSDMISRKALIDEVMNTGKKRPGIYTITGLIRMQPSVEPEQKTAKNEFFTDGWYKCSNCHACHPGRLYKYCPNCGAEFGKGGAE